MTTRALIAELLLRVRHWLIEALGGYTRQQIIEQRFIHPPSLGFSPTVVQAVHRVLPYELRLVGGMAEEEMFQFVKKELTYELVKELLKNQTVLFDCSEDPMQNERIYRARITVIDPKTVQIFR